MRDSPFAEHKPSRFHRLPGVVLRLLTLALVAAVWHHFTFQGELSDTQWTALNIDGIELGTPRSQIQSCRDYLHFDTQQRVRYVSGHELRLQNRVLLRIGDEITSAREILGQPKIVNDRGAIYYYYHRTSLHVGCALDRRERITQISLEKSEKKQLKH